MNYLLTLCCLCSTEALALLSMLSLVRTPSIEAYVVICQSNAKLVISLAERPSVNLATSEHALL